ncbi:MAG TPA: cadherin domain-containing protein [Allosphingosinicella sp.]|jgi:hypothetical protein
MPNYVAVGSEFTVNSVTGGWQNYPDFAKLKGGRFVGVWESPDSDGSEGLRGRVFGPDGLPIGPDFAINTATKDDQKDPSVAGLADGGFVVTWSTRDPLQDGSYDAIKAQRFDASGVKVGAEFLVNSMTTSIQWQPAVTSLDNGGFVITWETYDSASDGSGRSIKAQIYNAAGVRVGGEFLVNTVTADEQMHPEISALAGGGFVAIWTTQIFGKLDVRAQIFDSTGAKVGSEILVNTQTFESQSEVQVSTLANGGFVVTWTTFDPAQDGSGYSIKAQLFNAAGAKVGGEFLVNAATASSQKMPTVSGLSNGDFVIAWRTDDQTADDSAGAIKAQVFSATGVKIDGEFRVNSTAGSIETDPVVVDLGNGAFMIGWTSSSSPAWDDNIRGQIYSSGSAPVIQSNGAGDTAALLIAEHQAAVTTVRAVDLDGPSTTYSLAGGADAALFSINASSGALTFIAAPDFATPRDSDGNNVYEVVVRASDGQRSDTQALSVTIASPASVPTIVSDGGGDQAALTVLENATYVTSVSAVDGDGDTMSYAIVGGSDAARFTINSATGALAFATAPNREAPTDANGDNVYQVVVRASDGTLSDIQTLSITVANVNEAPVIMRFGSPVSDTTITSMSEGFPGVGTFTAVDPEANPLNWTLTGADAALFAFNVATGELRFITTPDFETPRSSTGSNSYSVTLGVSDGSLADSVAITVVIRDVNEAPVIVSNGGGATAAVTAAENQIAVTTVAAVDPERSTALTFSIAGGADAARFAINASTGVLTFVQAPNFEAPQDAGGNNVYDVVVAVSDGSKTGTQAIAVTVANVNEAAPVIAGSETSFLVTENGTAVASFSASDADGDVLTWSIAGGADAGRFAIDPASGALRYLAAPDFEAPADAGGDNLYDVTIAVSDGSLTATRALTVQILNSNEAPVIGSNGGGATAAISMAEEGLFVTTVAASDPEGTAVSYSIAGGADAMRFAIDSTTGALTFLTAPNYEQPEDLDGDNVYEVIVRASDGGISDTQALSITVANANERPIITTDGGQTSAFIEIDEGQTAVTNVLADDPDGPDGVTYSITGGAHAGLFVIDAATGALSFAAAPDYEAPLGESNNFYSVTVTASDGELSSFQSIQVAVRNVNEAVTITSGAAASVGENATAVMTVTAQDLDGDSVSFAISGGADAALFAVDAATGALSFLAAPNFEAPADSDGNNVYDVEVRASDGTLSDSRAVSVTVVNVDEPVEIVSYGGAATVSVSRDEGLFGVGRVEASDPEGATIAYSIAGGADAAMFEIDPDTGALRFAFPAGRPDFEAPADSDGDNVYQVTVAATAGAATATQAFQVTIVDRNEGIFITSNGGNNSVGLTQEEGTSYVTTVTAHDPEGVAPVYSITGGNDAARFVIDSATGVLSFVEATDYETPLDTYGTNIYVVIVTASDGVTSSWQYISVLITNVNEAVTITSGGGADSVAVTINEDRTAVADVDAVDSDGTTVFYSIAGGADAAFFTIDLLTGALSLVGADYDVPADADGDNVYEVIVSADDGWLSDTQAFSVTVADVDEPLFFTSYNSDFYVSLDLDENSLDAAVVAAEDPEGRAIVYSIVDSYQGANFTIDPQTGVVRFVSAPDYEAPTDPYGNNIYTVLVAATDGRFFDYQNITFHIGNVAERPTITTGPALSVNEDSAFVARVAATDGDGDAISYAIVGGADASHFVIDPATGDLTLAGSLDYEAPADADGDNVYEVTVRASDGQLSDARQFSITVNDVYDDVEIVSYGGADLVTLTVQEGGSLQVADLEASLSPFAGVTFAITGGADANLFRVDPYSGVLSFAYGVYPDFEAPADAGGNNVYDVVVTASNASSSDDQAFAITVSNRNESLWITSNNGGDATVAINEGGRNVTTVLAFDPDGDVPTYSIVGGADAALFAIDPATGVLTFIAAPDYEAPHNGTGANVYFVAVGASDGEFLGTQRIRVEINNVNEGVAITSGGGGAAAAVTVGENGLAVTTLAASDADGDPLTWSIAGGADSSRFTIDARTGALSFVQAPNFEAPADSGGNNVYDVVVSVTDGTFTDSQAVAVTVANVNEGLAITSNGGGASASITVAENGTAVATVAATDPDGGAVTYAIAGGADAARFTIDSSTGALAFVSAPDFEAPADAGANNVYDVVVSATDGSFTDTQAIAVTVGNVNEGVAITSNGGGASAAVTVAENGTAVATVAATDPDGGAVTYAIAGGADSNRFTINAATGVLAFVAAPNFEAPGDSGGNNVYDVIVSASDGTFTDTQAIAVTVGNVNEAPVITSGGGGASAAVSVAENGTAVATVAATDLDGGAVTYAIAGGADSSRFTINATTGVLTFVAAPNFEAPGDSGGNNVYDVIVSASDGVLTDTQAIAVTVGNVNEAPVITSGGGAAAAAVSVAENSLAVTLVGATDPDGTALTYSIVGGADAARFTINPQTGALQFVAAPDWELPSDSNGDNIYAVVVRSSDGQLFDDQALSVSVTNTVDGNNVTGTAGGDTISATSTNVALRTSNEEDVVFGRDGHDTIYGMAGDDDLYGEAGNDVLIGGAGADRLTGGLGKDTFTYGSLSESTSASRDMIMDFSRSQGDKISLSAIDANTGVGGDQAFTFIGNAAFSNVAGQLRFETSGGITIISGDVNGDGIADLQIQLSGTVVLTASDFVL